MTYKQAYDKIIEAYFKDEIQPYRPNFCFCGTLCGNESWQHPKHQFEAEKHNYSYFEYGKLEFALLSALGAQSMYRNGQISSGYCIEKDNPKYEDALFRGMCAALDVLKQIHKERGEDVDEELKLTKRELI